MTNTRKINDYITLGILDLRAFSTKHGISIKREQEKAGTRFLLNELLGGNDFILDYTPQNKPYLKNSNTHISISHSHDKLVIILNQKHATGVDIEMIRDKVIKVRHKFLNDHEAAFAGDDLEKLITIWAAKEAMYKAYGLRGVDFKLHLSVDNFSGTDLSGRLNIGKLKKIYQLKREVLEGYILVYIIDEDGF